MANTTKVTVRQTGSPIRRKSDQRATLIGLGLEPAGPRAHAGRHPSDDGRGDALGAGRQGGRRAQPSSNSMRQVGGSLGIAVMGAVVASRAAATTAPAEIQKLAFLHGFHDALRIAAVLALAGAVVATTMIRKAVHHHAPAEAAPAVEAI